MGQDQAFCEELEDRTEGCPDLIFMHVFLRLGYEFPPERGVRIEKQIEGTELGWCLGATIPVVGGELTRRNESVFAVDSLGSYVQLFLLINQCD